MIQYLNDQDIIYSRRLFRWSPGKCVNYIAYAFSSIFMEEIIVVTLVGLHFYFGQSWYNSCSYLIIFTSNLIMTGITKKVIGKARPDIESLPRTDKSLFFRKKQHYNASLPSGDTIQAWTLVLFAGIYTPGWRFWVLSPIALLTPLSRIYLCCHFISDCICGALFSTITTVVTHMCLQHPKIQGFLKGL